MGSDLPAAVCVRTGEPVFYGSRLERDRRWPALAGAPARAEAVVVLPLVAGDGPLGCLHIGYARQMAAGEIDWKGLARLAELCAAALYRARVYDAERERQAFLLDAWTAVAGAGGYADTLRRLAAIAVPRLADLCLIDVRDVSNRARRMAAVHADPAQAGLVAELGAKYSPAIDGSHPASAAMATGLSTWSATMPDEFLRATTKDQRHYDIVKALGFTSYVCVPLVSGEEILGAITLVSAGSGRRFNGSDLALAEELATRVASVVSSARRHDRDQVLVHELQRLLLPEALPEHPGLEVAVRYLTAATEAEAGGDFYDVVLLPSGRLGLAIGDVEGHDTMAAAVMGQLRSASRVLAGQFREPGRVVDSLRWSWDLLGFGRMATAVFCRVDPASGEVAMASAGHLPPVLVSQGGLASFVPVDPSPPFGVAAGEAVDSRFVMERGETLLFYTDGLVERHAGALEGGLEELRSFVQQSALAPLEELCDAVLAGLARPGPRLDDVALLAVRWWG
jgi:serine/threonine-protein kinase RsbW